MNRRYFIKHAKLLNPDKKASPECRTYPGRNVHHLTPRTEGGLKTPDNTLLLLVESHDAWHQLFGTRSIEEAIALLNRVCGIKRRLPIARSA